MLRISSSRLLGSASAASTSSLSRRMAASATNWGTIVQIGAETPQIALVERSRFLSGALNAPMQGTVLREKTGQFGDTVFRSLACRSMVRLPRSTIALSARKKREVTAATAAQLRNFAAASVASSSSARS